VALKGMKTDGHDYVHEAAEKGAAACVNERPTPGLAVPAIVVEDTAKALALLAAAYHGNPADDLFLCGVTGTNGKTSTVHMLRRICEVSGWGKTGIVGTVGHGAGDDLEPALHTTPDAVKLHSLFKKMKDEGCRGVVMEVSSHAVRQQRTWGLEFEVGIITNVTRDHLDYHPSIEDYVAAKREFCFSLVSAGRKKPEGTLIYFSGDPSARRIGEEFPGRKIPVGLDEGAEVRARSIEADLSGTRFDLVLGPDVLPVKLRVLGSFSVPNALLAAAAAKAIGIDAEGIKAGLEALASVPGRFEALGGGEKPVVIVDYSHTPDSIERVLKFCRELGPKRLITVFGCGGDRDRGKRAIMGGIVQEHSDVSFVTSDNPRTEDPRLIIEDILEGMDRSAGGIVVIEDRREAIKQAVAGARKGDMVAICGKGHEDYQIIGRERIHFSDKEEAAKALADWRGD